MARPRVYVVKFTTTSLPRFGCHPVGYRRCRVLDPLAACRVAALDTRLHERACLCDARCTPDRRADRVAHAGAHTDAHADAAAGRAP